MKEPRVWPKGFRNKTCPRCGRGLVCGASPGEERCWCDARPHVALPNGFADCLCPTCLDEEIAKISTRAAG